MNFLICPIDPKQLDLFNSNKYMTSDTGEAYSYKVEYEPEGIVRITDNCDRIMPFDITEIDELIEVLERISAYEQCSQCIFDRLVDGYPISE